MTSARAAHNGVAESREKERRYQRRMEAGHESLRHPVIVLRNSEATMVRTTKRSIVFVILAITAPVVAFATAPKSDSFDAKGVKIHYLLAGSGEPVVLIHGLDSSAEINWNVNGVVGELAKDHEVVAFDMPGHGRSDKPTSDDAYGRQIVEDVVLLMDHLKLKKAHIVGYSLGGMVAPQIHRDAS